QHITDPKTIKEYVAEFFQELLTNNLSIEADNSNGFSQHVSLQENDMLCGLPTREEIKNAVFLMCPYNVAGTDRFSPLYYQFCRDIIAQDVTEAVQDFYFGTPLPKSFEVTSVALIPKVTNLSTRANFRPISLCNVSNKICSKIMNERIAKILPDISTQSQSGFVGGRLISDNILLAHEVIQTLEAKRRYDNVVYKLDMLKAYDRVQWQILYDVMRKMGFNEKWIQLVRNCIKQCWFNILLNGDKAGSFQSSRGLRQGGPRHYHLL
ncbi:hypothetical protein Sango_2869000, partial [Sesamum angolense]